MAQFDDEGQLAQDRSKARINRTLLLASVAWVSGTMLVATTPANAQVVTSPTEASPTADPAATRAGSSAPDATPRSPDDPERTATNAPGDIVVTARRRDETLQNVPASVTVLSDQAIETAGIKQVSDLSKVVPSLVINENFRPGVLNIALRGITSVQGAEPSVAVVIDGVQLPSLEFVNQNLVDLANVQILKGPQGALYGRGAIAGAIVIETRRPTNEFDTRLNLLAGNADTYVASGAISGPVVADHLFFRAVASYKTSDGLIYNEPNDKPFDFYRTTNLRGQLLWEPDARTKIDLTASYEKGRNGVSGFLLLPPTVPISDFPDFDQQSDPLTIEHRSLQLYSARLSHEADWGTLSAISLLARSRSSLAGDTDFLALPLFLQYNTVKVRSFNQDVRYTSPSSWPVQFFIGGFYQHRTTLNDLYVPADPTGPFAGFVLADSDQKDTSEALAGYGQVTVPFSDATELGLALRYDRERRTSVDQAVSGSFAKAIFSSWQPQVTLRQRITPELTVYGTIGKGFSSGGFNAFADVVASPDTPRVFPKETNTNYEAGIKGSLLDRTLSFQLSAYHTDFRNQVFFFINPGTNSRVTLPIARSRINGGELEASWRATSNLTFGFGAALNDAKIRDAAILVGGASQPFAGNLVPGINKYTINASVDMKVPTSFGEIYGRANYNHRGAIKYDLANRFGYGELDFVDLRLGVRVSKFDVSAFVNNLTDQRYPLFFQNNLIGNGDNAILANLPRTYGLEVRARF